MESKQTQDLSNGFYFGHCYLAKEIIGHIFCFADIPTLANCRLVCRLWQTVVEDPLLWKKKTLMVGKKWPKIPVSPTIPWIFYAEIYRKQPFERNLVVNPCGAERLKHWNILSQAGDGFAIESPPVGSDAVPDHITACHGFQNSCFATSYHSCSKEQIIDLKALGIPDIIMDVYKPFILVSEWYAGRFDCGCVYECEVSLLDEKSKVLTKFQFRANIKQWEGSTWQKMEKVLHDYPEGVRFIKFYHGGTDTQFWRGNYGSKFTAATVILQFDRDPSIEPTDEEV